MTEATIEARLTREVKHMGGVAYKFVSPGTAGVPDRLVVLPGGRVLFVELKTDTGRLSPGQRVQLDRLRSLGAEAHVVRGKAGVDTFLVRCRELVKGGGAK